MLAPVMQNPGARSGAKRRPWRCDVASSEAVVSFPFGTPHHRNQIRSLGFRRAGHAGLSRPHAWLPQHILPVAQPFLELVSVGAVQERGSQQRCSQDDEGDRANFA